MFLDVDVYKLLTFLGLDVFTWTFIGLTFLGLAFFKCLYFFTSSPNTTIYALKVETNLFVYNLFGVSKLNQRELERGPSLGKQETIKQNKQNNA